MLCQNVHSSWSSSLQPYDPQVQGITLITLSCFTFTICFGHFRLNQLDEGVLLQRGSQQSKSQVLFNQTVAGAKHGTLSVCGGKLAGLVVGLPSGIAIYVSMK